MFHFMLTAIGGALLGIFMAYAVPLVVLLMVSPASMAKMELFQIICTVTLGVYGLLGGIVIGMHMANKMHKMVIKPPPPPKKEGL